MLSAFAATTFSPSSAQASADSPQGMASNATSRPKVMPTHILARNLAQTRQRRSSSSPTAPKAFVIEEGKSRPAARRTFGGAPTGAGLPIKPATRTGRCFSSPQYEAQVQSLVAKYLNESFD